MPPVQVVVMFNVLVWLTYRNRLVVHRVSNEVEQEDRRWKEVAAQVLVNTQNNIAGKGKETISALLQLEQLD